MFQKWKLSFRKWTKTQGCFCGDFCPARQVWNRSCSRQFHLFSLRMPVSWAVPREQQFMVTEQAQKMGPKLHQELFWCPVYQLIEMLTLVCWEIETSRRKTIIDMSEKQHIMKISFSDSYLRTWASRRATQTFYVKSVYCHIKHTQAHIYSSI